MDEKDEIAAFLQYINSTEPGSEDRFRAITHGIQNNLFNYGYGADITVTNPSGHYFALMDTRKNPQANGAADSVGPFGGRANEDEMPIVNAVREMMEEMVDAQILTVPADMHANKFIAEKTQELENIITSKNPAITLEQARQPENIPGILKNLRDVKFQLSESVEIDLGHLRFIDQGSPLDLSYFANAAKGEIQRRGNETKPVITRPYMFDYQTATNEEFKKFLTKGKDFGQSQIDPSKEVACISAIGIDELWRINPVTYNPEKSYRYVHAGMVMARRAVEKGMSPEGVLKNIFKHEAEPEKGLTKLAQLMGQSPEQIIKSLSQPERRFSPFGTSAVGRMIHPFKMPDPPPTDLEI